MTDEKEMAVWFREYSGSSSTCRNDFLWRPPWSLPAPAKVSDKCRGAATTHVARIRSKDPEAWALGHARLYGSFSGGGPALLPFYENLAKQALTIVRFYFFRRPFPVSRSLFYRFTYVLFKHTNFSSSWAIVVLRARKGAGECAEKSPKSPNGPLSDV